VLHRVGNKLVDCPESGDICNSKCPIPPYFFCELSKGHRGEHIAVSMAGDYKIKENRKSVIW
jgi:hypothetical protein